MLRLIGIPAVMILCALSARGSGFRQLDFNSALAKAAEEKKPLFIDFYVTWCRPCKEMDQTTWKDAEVQKLLQEKVIAIRVNSDQFADLTHRYQVAIHPTLAFINSKGELTDRIIGYVKPEEFKADFADALSGKGALQRAEEKWKRTGENKPLARMEYARTLEFNQARGKALEQYIWCWDEGLKHDPSFALTRRTFLLAEWARLARNFPDARKAMEERKEKAEKQLAAGDGSVEQELNAMKRFLEPETVP